MKLTNRLSLILTFFLCALFISPAIYAGKDHYHATESKDENIRNKALTSKIWWNQKVKSKKLALTDDQKHDMDHVLLKYLRHHTKDVKAEKKAFKDLSIALSSGDKDKTKLQRDNLIKTTSDSTARQVNMMSDIVSLLTEEQRKIVATNYPALFSRLWIRSANPAAFQMGKKERKIKKKAN
ncbi:MAG: Spy/CpxP family protein refolding chaperone [Rickettsiaceae bacterium]